jgi:hypothetical protein
MEEDKDRENTQRFKSWEIPTAPDKLRKSAKTFSVSLSLKFCTGSRVRKVILTGLPAGSDLTMVQSLISGGVIDNYNISPAGSTAYVTFTSGDACDKFHDKYPNGITFKHRGKAHTVFVDKSKDVDVVSDMLQGYLDCGASRCVRAVGADEDWGMGALYKLAYGKSRKVEAVIDTLRNNVGSPRSNEISLLTHR